MKIEISKLANGLTVVTDPMPGLAQKGFAAAAPAHAKPCKR